MSSTLEQQSFIDLNWFIEYVIICKFGKFSVIFVIVVVVYSIYQCTVYSTQYWTQIYCPAYSDDLGGGVMMLLVM